MKYPLPSYAATIWYNGQGYTLILPEGDQEYRHTFTKLADAEEVLRTHHALATVAREDTRVESDLPGGRFARRPAGPSAEELRRIGDKILADRRAAAREAARLAKNFTLEDLGL